MQRDNFAKAVVFFWCTFSAIFKMISFFEYKQFFRAVFCIAHLQCVVKTFFNMFLCIFNFDPKFGFGKGYSLCLEAIFGNIQNGLIFRILAVFFSFLIFDPRRRF